MVGPYQTIFKLSCKDLTVAPASARSITPGKSDYFNRGCSRPNNKGDAFSVRVLSIRWLFLSGFLAERIQHIHDKSA